LPKALSAQSADQSVIAAAICVQPCVREFGESFTAHHNPTAQNYGMRVKLIGSPVTMPKIHAATPKIGKIF
jgi:hypothetical protein